MKTENKDENETLSETVIDFSSEILGRILAIFALAYAAWVPLNVLGGYLEDPVELPYIGIASVVLLVWVLKKVLRL